MMDHDAQAICGPRHARGRERQAHRWGKTNGKIAFHGGKVDIERPRLRGFDGKEHPPQSADFIDKYSIVWDDLTSQSTFTSPPIGNNL